MIEVLCYIIILIFLVWWSFNMHVMNFFYAFSIVGLISFHVWGVIIFTILGYLYDKSTKEK